MDHRHRLTIELKRKILKLLHEEILDVIEGDMSLDENKKLRIRSSSTNRDSEEDYESESEEESDSSEDDEVIDNFQKNVSSARESSSKPVHRGVTCTHCRKVVAGYRYMCLQCVDCNLCSTCESSNIHPNHCMIRLPSPTVYPLVRPFLEPLKDALNNTPGVSKNVPRPEILNIKQEPQDESYMETGNYNIVVTIDPLGEPKSEFFEESEASDDNVHPGNGQTKEYFNIVNPAKKILTPDPPAVFTPTKQMLKPTKNPSKTKHTAHSEPAQLQPQSTPTRVNTKRKLSDPDTSRTQAEDYRMRVDTAGNVKHARVEDQSGMVYPRETEIIPVYDIKIETEEIDTEDNFNE